MIFISSIVFQCKFTELKRENIHKDQVLEKANQQLCEMDMKLKQSTRKLQDRGNEESKLFEDMNRVNAELRKCRENYSSLESQNARISVCGNSNLPIHTTTVA